MVQSSVSIYFFAGDFVDVLQRHERGLQQIYATHDEVAHLIHDLSRAGVELTIYSFVTPGFREERPIHGVRIVALGASDYSAIALLRSAVEADQSEAIIAHFGNMELLGAVKRSGRKAMAVLANSYNRSGPTAILERHRVASMLNSERFELVSNHCLPATEHLADIGVKRRKLIAWDVPHRFGPAETTSKTLRRRTQYQIAYAGSINEDKGVGDLIRAIARLREHGIELHGSLAGAGDIPRMKALATTLGVSELLTFRGLIGNDDVFEMFRSADLVTVPSRSHYAEGFPLTMFEAIASRTPIVCSDHPMFRSVMKNGVNAVLFRAGDDSEMSDVMKHLLSDSFLYETLSQNALMTWGALQGPADWRTLLTKWVLEGADSSWIRANMLAPI
jgi:glycosyltransferase involved in cell wall biosynthesis